MKIHSCSAWMSATTSASAERCQRARSSVTSASIISMPRCRAMATRWWPSRTKYASPRQELAVEVAAPAVRAYDLPHGDGAEPEIRAREGSEPLLRLAERQQRGRVAFARDDAGEPAIGAPPSCSVEARPADFLGEA